MQSPESQTAEDFYNDNKTKTYGGKGFKKRKNKKKEGF